MIHVQNETFFPVVRQPTFWQSLESRTEHRWCRHPELDDAPLDTPVRRERTFKTEAALEYMRATAVQDVRRAFRFWKQTDLSWRFLAYFASNLGDAHVPLPTIAGMARPRKAYADIIIEYLNTRFTGPPEPFARIQRDSEARLLCQSLSEANGGEQPLGATELLVALKKANKLTAENVNLLYGGKEKLASYLLEDRQRASLWFSFMRMLYASSPWSHLGTTLRAPVDIPMSLADGHSFQVKDMLARFDHMMLSHGADVSRDIVSLFGNISNVTDLLRRVRDDHPVLLDVDDLGF